MQTLLNVLAVAVTAPPILIALTGCSFSGPTQGAFPAGETPRDAAIFCNIEKGRECATAMDVMMGVDIARQYEDGLYAGKKSQFGLDYSPAALAACNGQPQKVLFHGDFPNGMEICLNPDHSFGVKPGVGTWPGVSQGAYASVTSACQAYCDNKGWVDSDGNTYRCDHIAWPAIDVQNAVLGACTAAGVLKPDFLDLRTLPPKPVIFTNALGVSAIAGTLRKTAATDMFDAGAASTAVLMSGDGYIEFTAGETNRTRVCGLATGTGAMDIDPGNGDINYGIYLGDGGELSVSEGGAIKFTLSAYKGTDRFRVAVVGGIVQYFRNGQLFYTSDQTVLYPLHVSASLFHQNATINDVTTSF